MRKPELDDLVKENKTLSAKIRVSDAVMEERIKTLETVNKRHQEENKKLRNTIKEMDELLEKYDSLLELAIAFLKH